MFQTAFPASFLPEVGKILFCGDIGDPIYAKDLVGICSYIKTSSPSTMIKIITNGSYKSADWWSDLGRVLGREDQVTFSVDGWDQGSNERYRVNSNFDSIIEGAMTLRSVSDCMMSWSMIYFLFNEEHVDRVRSLARNLGFDMFEAVKSTKFDGRYLIDGIDPLKPVHTNNVSVFTTYNKDARERLRERAIPVFLKQTKEAHPWAKCLNWQKELFINVDGLVFPCPWFNSGYQDNDFVDKYRDRISVRNRTLMDILNDPLWGELITRFETMPLEVCRIKCKNGKS